eukprot:gene8688-11739_t
MIDVCIIGAGIGGLSAAISLQQMGMRVKVYEKDKNFNDRKQGYGLTLTRSITGPLAELNLLDKCDEKNSLSQSHYTFTPNGEIMGYYGRAFLDIGDKKEVEEINHSKKNNEQGGHQSNIRIPRQDLREILMNKLLPDTIVWGRKVITYEESYDCVTIDFENIMNFDSSHEFVQARVVVGADGIHSIIRRLRDEKDNKYNNYNIKINKTVKSSEEISFCQSKLNYLGVSVIIGLSVTNHPLLVDRGFYVLDGVHRLFTMPYGTITNNDSNDKNDGTLHTVMWQLSFSGISEEEGLQLRSFSFQQLRDEALKRTKDWFHPIGELIKSSLINEIWGTPLYDRDPMQPRSKQQMKTRVTVIGDACHPMSMFKGQGANQALKDGPLLAKHLTHLTKMQNNHNNNNNKRKHGSVFNTMHDVSEKPAMNDNNNTIHHKPNQVEGEHRVDYKLVCGMDHDNLLKSDSIYTKLRCFEQEMISRTSKKVLDSRQAAIHLHSMNVLNDHYAIEGLSDDMMTRTSHHNYNNNNIDSIKNDDVSGNGTSRTSAGTIKIIDKLKESGINAINNHNNLDESIISFVQAMKKL